MRLLDDALGRSIPDSRRWERKLYPSTPNTPAPSEFSYYIQLSSPVRRNGQSLVVQLRHDRDIQVEYHVDDDRKHSFETFFILPVGQERDAIEAIAHFVADILAERLVLVRPKSMFEKTRFLEQGSLTESNRGRARSITSWLGTFDWPTPG